MALPLLQHTCLLLRDSPGSQLGYHQSVLRCDRKGPMVFQWSLKSIHSFLALRAHRTLRLDKIPHGKSFVPFFFSLNNVASKFDGSYSTETWVCWN
jgi:hypothetical protein